MSDILHISDLHLLPKGEKVFGFVETYGRFLSLCACLKNLRYDAIVCTGDMFHNSVNPLLERFFRKKISCPNLFFVEGNHDRGCGESFLFDLPDCRLVGFNSMSDIARPFLLSALAVNKPILLFFHHPPVASGRVFLDKRCAAVAHLLTNVGLKGKNVLLCCGHLHQALTSTFLGCVVVCAPPLGFGLELTANGKNAMIDNSAGLVLHSINKDTVISRFLQIPGEYTFKKLYFTS